MTSIYISHKIQEVLNLSDTVTIIRDGKTIHAAPTADMNEKRIISMMVGRDFSNRFPERVRQKTDQVILEVENWSLTRPGRLANTHSRASASSCTAEKFSVLLV